MGVIVILLVVVCMPMSLSYWSRMGYKTAEVERDQGMKDLSVKRAISVDMTLPRPLKVTLGRVTMSLVFKCFKKCGKWFWMLINDHTRVSQQFFFFFFYNTQRVPCIMNIWTWVLVRWHSKAKSLLVRFKETQNYNQEIKLVLKQNAE